MTTTSQSSNTPKRSTVRSTRALIYTCDRGRVSSKKDTCWTCRVLLAQPGAFLCRCYHYAARPWHISQWAEANVPRPQNQSDPPSRVGYLTLWTVIAIDHTYSSIFSRQQLFFSRYQASYSASFPVLFLLSQTRLTTSNWLLLGYRIPANACSSWPALPFVKRHMTTDVALFTSVLPCKVLRVGEAR